MRPSTVTSLFTAAQAAQKSKSKTLGLSGTFTAAQAAQKALWFEVLEALKVHCRTGSSETFGWKACFSSCCSLPHRQLRNYRAPSEAASPGSLPHRQLRNIGRHTIINLRCSLPHRQLRKIVGSKGLLGSGSLPHRQLRNNQS